MIQLMCLVETGTRGLLGAAFGPTSDGETTYAQQLIGLLNDGMLVLADRGFDSNAFLQAVAGAKAVSGPGQVLPPPAGAGGAPAQCPPTAGGEDQGGVAGDLARPGPGTGAAGRPRDVAADAQAAHPGGRAARRAVHDRAADAR